MLGYDFSAKVLDASDTKCCYNCLVRGSRYRNAHGNKQGSLCISNSRSDSSIYQPDELKHIWRGRKATYVYVPYRAVEPYNITYLVTTLVTRLSYLQYHKPHYGAQG